MARRSAKKGEVSNRGRPDSAVPDSSPSARLALAARLWDWQPHPGQRELFLSDAAVKVAACGRRWGKTETLSVDVATATLTRPGFQQMIVAPTYMQSRILFDRGAHWLQLALDHSPEEFPHLVGMVVKRSPFPQILIEDKIILSGRTAGRDGSGLRGDGVDRIIVDEAAYVREVVIKEVLMPMLATTPGGGQLTLISTPFGRRGLFFDMYLKGMDAKNGVAGARVRYWAIQLPSAQNPLVSRDYLIEQKEDLLPAVFAAEYEAEFVEDGGTVFLEADIRAAIVEDDHREPVKGVRYVAGVDFGRRGDYTVVTVLACLREGPRVVEQIRLQGLSWSGQLERVLDVLQRWRCINVATDRTGLGDPLSESLALELVRRRLGTALDEVVFTQTTKAALIDNVALALSQGRLKFPAYPELLSELRAFSATRTASGAEKLAASKGHDDTVCALALAVHAAGPIIVSVGLGTQAVVGGARRVVFSCSQLFPARLVDSCAGFRACLKRLYRTVFPSGDEPGDRG